MHGNRPFRARRTGAPVLLLLLLLASGCGREAPSYAPGTLTVTSDPAGAAIFIDGRDTGETTPFTFADMPAAAYEVGVALPPYLSTPGSRIVTVAPLGHADADFSLVLTALTVASEPAGARITLDGLDTGLVTPAEIGVEPGLHRLALDLDGFRFLPGELAMDVAAGEILEIPASAFMARSLRTVLLEGFSNIFCQGCPELSANLHALQLTEGYGLDRVLVLKFSMSWPLRADPHYQYNVPENDGRLLYYGPEEIIALPTLYADGALQGSAGNPPGPGSLRDLVDLALLGDPGFFIDVEADFTLPTVPVTVTLTALDGEVDLTGTTLFVALTQDQVDYLEPPVEPNLGETTFYWLFRDMADQPPSPGALGSGSPLVMTLDVVRGDWDPASCAVIAFVQDQATRAVLQAGSTATPPLSAAPADTYSESANR